MRLRLPMQTYQSLAVIELADTTAHTHRTDHNVHKDHNVTTSSLDRFDGLPQPSGLHYLQ
jgi:hypothetical protein